MSEWNYTKCSKPFSNIEEALEFMIANSFDGQVLERAEGYSAVCPTYPKGFYPDAVPVAEYSAKVGVITDKELLGTVMISTENTMQNPSCCPVNSGIAITDSKCC